MSDLAISVSVEGMDLASWEPAFRSALAHAPTAFGLTVSAMLPAGALGARRSGAVKVTGSAAGSTDGPIKVLGVLISALSLAVGATQLGLKLQEGHPPSAPAAPTFVCRIEGPQGAKELIVSGTAIPSEHVLRECLKATGTPTKLSAVPPKKP